MKSINRYLALLAAPLMVAQTPAPAQPNGIALKNWALLKPAAAGAGTTSATGLTFIAITPCRLVDTRAGASGSGNTGPFGPPSLEGAVTRVIPVPQSNCGVPAAAAYSLNFVSISPQGQAVAYLAAWPDNIAWPGTVILNAPLGGIVDNSAIVPAGPDGGIEVEATNNADLVIDMNGYYVPVGAGPQGPAGSEGPQGPQGPQGLQGAAGPAGPAGSTGAQGLAGAIGPSGSPGAAGSIGPGGPIGPTGLTGALGPSGSPGTAGAIGPGGPIGPTGLTGAIGPAGTTGPAGAPGAGIVFAANIINSATDGSFFFSPNASGDATVGGDWITFAQVAVPMPVGCAFDSLYVTASAVGIGLGEGGVITVTLYKNTVATALTVTTTSVVPAVNSITGQSVAVAAGDLIALEASGPGTSSGSDTIAASLHCH